MCRLLRCQIRIDALLNRVHNDHIYMYVCIFSITKFYKIKLRNKIRKVEASIILKSHWNVLTWSQFIGVYFFLIVARIEKLIIR